MMTGVGFKQDVGGKKMSQEPDADTHTEAKCSQESCVILGLLAVTKGDAQSAGSYHLLMLMNSPAAEKGIASLQTGS